MPGSKADFMRMGQTDNLTRILLMHKDLSGTPRLCADLGLAGWNVVEATDEIEALEIAKSVDLGAAILHFPIGEVTGMDFPQVLRNVTGGKYLPVVVVTEGPHQRRCEFLDSGADDIVSVDIHQDELVARVSALLRVKKLHDQLHDSQTALQEALRRERNLLAKLRKDNEYLKHLATTDPLTHAQNLRSFRDILEHEFRMARRYNRPLSLLMLDIDHFKVVNDTHGHPSGDYVLKELTVILKQVTRDSDIISRTGGEEFTVLLTGADAQRAATYAERIRTEVFAREFVVYGDKIHVTVSIGATTYPSDAEITDPEMLVQLADQALYSAKEDGRDRVVAFHDLDAIVRERLCRQYAMERFAGEPQSDGIVV